jgi:hypothetical protein
MPEQDQKTAGRPGLLDSAKKLLSPYHGVIDQTVSNVFTRAHGWLVAWELQIGNFTDDLWAGDE